MEIILAIVIIAFIFLYRKNYDANNTKFIDTAFGKVYEKYAPYSYKEISKKVRELGLSYSVKEYTIQILLFGGVAFAISYLYFYSIWVTVIYVAAAILVVPYLAYMRMKRIYSEYIFEQVQVYATNVIMEFSTTQSFVKALEGVYSSGVVEDPVKSDIKVMLDMAYEKGTIDEAIAYMNNKYDYHIIRNMHQLFLQITKEGSLENTEVLENMLLDIDMLVENVYRDRMDRKAFHRSFIQYGLMLYLMVMLVQYLLGVDTYLKMLQEPVVVVMLHIVVLLNSFFLWSGEKYYNENVGVE